MPCVRDHLKDIIDDKINVMDLITENDNINYYFEKTYTALRSLENLFFDIDYKYKVKIIFVTTKNYLFRTKKIKKRNLMILCIIIHM